MNKLNKFLKDKKVIFIIGSVGSGKTTLANEIDQEKIIYEDMTFFNTPKELFRKKIMLKRNIIKARHGGKSVVLITNYKIYPYFMPLNQKYEFNSEFDLKQFAYIFIGLSFDQIDYYSRSFNRAYLKYNQNKFIKSIKNKRKTRPYLIISGDLNSAITGRFKLK